MDENRPVLAADDEGAATAVDEVGEDAPDLGYRVSLDAFTGPLDLLLYLVRRAEVDIFDIPVVAITDQYLATIATWEEADLEVAGDFILMAATLLEIKARMLAPPREDEEGEEEDEPELVDPRADLIQQLLAFRQVKEVVNDLHRLEEEGLRRHGRRYREAVPEDPELERGIDLENADPYQLFLAWDAIQQTIAGHGPRTLSFDDVPIEERRRDIEAAMREAREAELKWLLERVDTPIKKVGVVIALLDSIRQRRIEAHQYEQYGAVHLRFIDDIERARVPESPPTEDAEEPAERRRRTRRMPLVTFHGEPQGTTDEDEGADVDEGELVIESDEQRFVRELNEQLPIDDLLAHAASIDRRLEEHLAVLGLVEEPVTADDEGTGSAAGRPTDDEDADEDEEELDEADRDLDEEGGADGDGSPPQPDG